MGRPRKDIDHPLAHGDKHAPAGYIVRVESDGSIKVGQTTNLKQRLRDHARRYKSPLTLLWAAEGGEQMEMFAVNALSEYAVPGEEERFRPEPPVLTFIDRVVADGLRWLRRERYHNLTFFSLIADDLERFPERRAEIIEDAIEARVLYWALYTVRPSLKHAIDTARGLDRGADLASLLRAIADELEHP